MSPVRRGLWRLLCVVAGHVYFGPGQAHRCLRCGVNLDPRTRR